jgi:hypothetical protein
MNSIGIRTYAENVTETLLDTSVDRWRIVTLDLEFVATVVKELGDAEPTDATIELLCASDLLGDLEQDFLLATKANDLVAADVLTIRERSDDDTETTTQLTSPDRTVVLVSVGGKEAVTMVVDDEDASERLWQKHQSAWDVALPYSLDSPPYSRMLAIADDVLGPNLRDDLDTAYNTVKSRGPDDRLEPLAVALLVGAKHERLFADVVDWAERTDLATQGMVSKRKGKLESLDLIETESESVGVGRPRQRLELSNDSLRDLPADELLAHAQTILT